MTLIPTNMMQVILKIEKQDLAFLPIPPLRQHIHTHTHLFLSVSSRLLPVKYNDTEEKQYFPSSMMNVI